MATRTISTKLAVEGESAYKSSLKNINSELGTLKSELKLVESEFSGQANTYAALSAKGEVLSKQYEAQKSKLDTLKEALENAKRAQETYGERVEDAKSNIQRCEEALEALKNTEGDTSAEQARLTAELEGYKRELSEAESYQEAATRSVNSWQTQVNTAQAELNRLDGELDKNNKYLKEAEQNSDGCADSISNLGSETEAEKEKQKAAAEAEKDHAEKMQNLGEVAKVVAAAIAAATAAVGAFVKDSLETGMEFDSSMSQIAATLGITSEEIEKNLDGAGDTFDALREKALQMGSETNFTATQAAEGLNILAMSGYSAEESIGMIEDVLHLSAAGAMDMASAAGYVAGAMKGFADESKDAAYYADLMAKGATLANTDVQALGEALSGGAAVAASYNQSADSVTVALLRLAEQGETGSGAATALSAAMKNLYAPTNKAKEALRELGVEAFDQATGEARDFNAIVNELGAALSEYSDEERTAYAQTIFGIQGFNAYNKMVGTSVEKQEEWNKALAQSSGEAAKQYATMTDNLQGDLDIFGSALDGLKIAISDRLMPEVRGFVKFGSDAIGDFAKAFSEQGISGAMESLGQSLSAGLQMIINLLPKAVEAGMSLLGALGEGIMSALPSILEAGAQIVTSLITGIAEALPDLIPAAVETVTQLVTALLDNMPLIIEAALQLITGLAEGIIAAIPVLLAALPEVIKSLISTLLDAIPQIIETGVKLLVALVENLPQIIETIIAVLPQIIESVITTLLDHIPEIIDAGVKLFIALIENLPLIITTVIGAIPQIITSIVTALVNSIPQIVQTGVRLLSSLIQNLPQVISTIVRAMPQIISSIVNALSQGISQVADVGKNLVYGLWNGIQSLAGWLWDRVSSWISSIWDGITGFFGISSPSKKMAWAGEMLVEGEAKGIERNAPKAVKAAEDMSADMLAEIEDGIGKANAELASSIGEIETSIDARATVRQVSSSLPYLDDRRSAAARSSGGDTTITNEFKIDSLVVREEADIKRIARELYNMQRTKSRGKGVVMA